MPHSTCRIIGKREGVLLGTNSYQCILFRLAIEESAIYQRKSPKPSSQSRTGLYRFNSTQNTSLQIFTATPPDSLSYDLDLSLPTQVHGRFDFLPPKADQETQVIFFPLAYLSSFVFTLPPLFSFSNANIERSYYLLHR